MRKENQGIRKKELFRLECGKKISNFYNRIRTKKKGIYLTIPSFYDIIATIHG